MTTVNAANNVINEYSVNNNQNNSSASSELDQSDFFKLMVTELNNQSPLEPMDNSQMLSQMTDISTSQGIDTLNATMNSMNASLLSNQALQASSMVGRVVMHETDKAVLQKDSAIAGSMALPQSSTNVSMSIYNDKGVLVDQIPLGAQESGDIEFVWNGQKGEGDDATSLPAGQYSFKATAEVDGKSVALTTTLSANVNSVSVDKSGQTTLNLNGLGSIGMTDVRRIM